MAGPNLVPNHSLSRCRPIAAGASQPNSLSSLAHIELWPMLSSGNERLYKLVESYFLGKLDVVLSAGAQSSSCDPSYCGGGGRQPRRGTGCPLPHTESPGQVSESLCAFPFAAASGTAKKLL